MTDAILDLLDRWDRQQEGYIELREQRFAIMFDILASALGEDMTVIDAACGPGSLSVRLLARFPGARVVAVDADVLLLEMARVALAPHADRCRVVEADLGQLDWTGPVGEAIRALGGDAPHAIVSTTALHWLAAGQLAEFYGSAGELLAPGGIVMNGDHMRFDARWPTLGAAAGRDRDRAEAAAIARGADDWSKWWERAAAIPRLAPMKVQRDAFFSGRRPKRATNGEDCPVDFHLASLRHAGFTEVGTAWQHLDNYVIFARKPQP